MTIGARLDEAMRFAGIPSQSALSRASGVPQPTINRILKGVGTKGPETYTILRLAEACGVNPQWLADGTGPIERGTLRPREKNATLKVSVSDSNAADFVGVRMVTKLLHAGLGGEDGDMEFSDDILVSLPTAWVNQKGLSPAKLVAIRITGESMYPTLRKGNIVIVNTADRDLRHVLDGTLYAVNHNGKPVVKRLEFEAGRWHLASDNPLPEFRRRPVDDTTKIVGRVVRLEADFI